MDMFARYNLQRGVKENSRFSSTNYASDFGLIDEYILAKVQMRQNRQERIILDPAAYNSLMYQAA